MKKYSAAILAFFFVLPSFAQQLSPKLESLLDKCDYFRFREEFAKDSASLDAFQQAYFSAYNNYLFNRPLASNEQVEKVIDNSSFHPADSLLADLFQLKMANDLRLFRYASADSTCHLLLKRYLGALNKKDSSDVVNSLQILDAIKDVPPQTMERSGDMDVTFKRDVVGLIRLPVKVNAADGEYVMDTGANLSTVTESEAKRVGIRVLNASFGVTSSSRSSVASKLGVADKITIGNVVFHHVIFIVLPDNSLKFAGGIYKIKGIIGFPVISQLGEVQVRKDSHIFSPAKQTESAVRNLGLDGNTPFTTMNVYGQDHVYIFDTGAATSVLSENFKTTYADSLGDTKTKNSHVGGAGGVQKVQMERLKDVHYELGGAKGVLKLAVIELNGTDDAFHSYFGIAGEDIYREWTTMTINFNTMFVLLQ